MKVYVVTCNDKIDQVFASEQAAQTYIKQVGGWNLWKVLEKDVKQ